jgi:hypothetical protein
MAWHADRQSSGQIDPMGADLPNLNFDHAYAIIRVEFDVLTNGVSDPERITNCITVIKLLWNESDATAEVERLNNLNREKGCFYFSQITRLQRRGR